MAYHYAVFTRRNLFNNLVPSVCVCMSVSLSKPFQRSVHLLLKNICSEIPLLVRSGNFKKALNPGTYGLIYKLMTAITKISCENVIPVLSRKLNVAYKLETYRQILKILTT